MFKRLKQTVKEKTGNAMITRFVVYTFLPAVSALPLPLFRYPVEVDQGINMTTEMLKNVKNIDAAITKQWSPYRTTGLTKLEKIANACMKVSAKKSEKKIGKITKITAALCTAIAKAERKCADDIQREYSNDFSKKIINGELKTAVKLFDELKKRRLDKDAANSEKGAAEKDAAYETQLSLVQAEIGNLPSYQRRHAAAIKKFLTIRMIALEECSLACEAAKPALE